MSSSAPTKFTKGQKACLVVFNIIENVKSFNTANGLRYRHDIFFIDDEKKIYSGEYLTPEPTQRTFEMNSKACIEALDHGVIQPVGTPEEWDKLGDNTILNADVSGKNFVYAIQCAAQINAARISLGQPIETADILKEADLIFDWMVSKHKRTLNIYK